MKFTSPNIPWQEKKRVPGRFDDTSASPDDAGPLAGLAGALGLSPFLAAWTRTISYWPNWSPNIKGENPVTYRAFGRATALALAGHVQLNTADRRTAIVVDVDRAAPPDLWESLNLPCPTFRIRNPENGHWHLVWALSDPVYRRIGKVWRWAACLEELFRRRLDGDWAMNASNLIKNPLSPRWECLVAEVAYRLEDLVEWLGAPEPFQKRTIRPERLEGEDVSLNPALFYVCRTWAYENVRFCDSPDVLAAGIRQAGARTSLGLSAKEREAVVQSVTAWVWERRACWPNGYGGGQDQDWDLGVMEPELEGIDDISIRQSLAGDRTVRIRREKASGLVERARQVVQDWIRDQIRPTARRLAEVLETPLPTVRRHCRDLLAWARGAAGGVINRSTQGPRMMEKDKVESSSIPVISLDLDKKEEISTVDQQSVIVKVQECIHSEREVSTVRPHPVIVRPSQSSSVLPRSGKSPPGHDDPDRNRQVRMVLPGLQAGLQVALEFHTGFPGQRIPPDDCDDLDGDRRGFLPAPRGMGPDPVPTGAQVPPLTRDAADLAPEGELAFGLCGRLRAHGPSRLWEEAPEPVIGPGLEAPASRCGPVVGEVEEEAMSSRMGRFPGHDILGSVVDQDQAPYQLLAGRDDDVLGAGPEPPLEPEPPDRLPAPTFLPWAGRPDDLQAGPPHLLNGSLGP
mgnify:FL=1